MKHYLVLVTLNDGQMKSAKQLTGSRKQITHALICVPNRQIFGTEKECRKYYSAPAPRRYRLRRCAENLID